MKILIVGKGKIAEKLNSLKLDNVYTYNYSIRDLIRKSFLINDFKSEIVSADIIIYLGYHHRSLIGNCIFLLQTLKFLSKIKWTGGFIFLNSQSILSSRIIKKKKEHRSRGNFEIYSVTKKIQSFILGYFEKKVKIFELFLPVVVGKDMNADIYFNKLSEYCKITLPNKGENNFAILGVDLFSNWLWMEIHNLISQGSSQLERKLFVYELLTTPKDIINCKLKEIGRNLDSVTFGDINLKYEYSNSFRSELKYKLKKSLIGLMIAVSKEQLGFINKNSISKDLGKTDNSIRLHYVVNGDEYYFYSRNIFLELIPFTALKISR